MKIKMKYTKNAILLGNGLNNHTNLGKKWVELLMSISRNALTEKNLKNKEITYPEFYDAVAFYNGKGTKEYDSLKNEICKQMKNWNGTSAHFNFTNFMKTNNIPIITTNYDRTLVDDKIYSYHKSQKCKEEKNLVFPLRTKKVSFTDYYPWDSYYSDHSIIDATSEFGIWHAHGIQCYERSIAIGAIDYGNNIARFKKYLPNKNLTTTDYWIGKNTWIDVFFNCNLYIVGFSFESQETSLRWLLMEREKYFRNDESRRKKTIYIVNDQYDKMSTGKKFLFDSLRIEIVHYPNGIEIYEKLELV